MVPPGGRRAPGGHACGGRFCRFLARCRFSPASDEDIRNCWSSAAPEVSKRERPVRNHGMPGSGENPAGRDAAGGGQERPRSDCSCWALRAGRQWTSEELDFLQSLRAATGDRSGELPAAGASLAFAAAVDEHVRFDPRHHPGARCRLPHHQGQPGSAGTSRHRPPADVIGSTCESVLPHTFGEWTGCPYCAMGGRRRIHRRSGSMLWRLLGGLDFVLHRARQPAKRNDSRGPGHYRTALGGRKISVCCLSRCRKASMSPRPTGQLLDCNDAFVHMLGYSTARGIAGAESRFRNLRRPQPARGLPARDRSPQLRAQLRSDAAPQGWHAAAGGRKQLCHARCDRQHRALSGIRSRHDGEAPRRR